MNLNNIIEQFDLRITGVLHIGANDGGEYQYYKDSGVEYMLFFEPVVANFERLLKNIPLNACSVLACNCALGNESGTKEMYIETSNHGQSCSLLEPKDHLTQYPSIKFDQRENVEVEKLDNIRFDRAKFNMINVDVQGSELEVFKGAEETLKSIDIIYTEVNRAELYKGCAMVEEIDSFLTEFKRVKTIWTGGSWGDALYLKSR